VDKMWARWRGGLPRKRTTTRCACEIELVGDVLKSQDPINTERCDATVQALERAGEAWCFEQ